MALEPGRHRLYVESHTYNISVTSTTEFIISKNLLSIYDINLVTGYPNVFSVLNMAQ